MTPAKRAMAARSLIGVPVLLLSIAFAGLGAASAQELDDTVDEVAAAWHRGDAAAIAAMSARVGMSLDVDGSSVGPLGPRQAAAVLRRVFDDAESMSIRTLLTRSVGGDPTRAFSELTWHTRARGTTVPEQAKLFVAFVQEAGRWCVSEIRLLR